MKPALNLRDCHFWVPFHLCLILLVPAAWSANPAPASPTLLDQFRAGPMAGVEHIVFAVRGVNPTDGHWYANFGHYGPMPDRKAYVDGTRLCLLNLDTKKLTTLIDDPLGGIRDPQVHYNARKILFSYRPGGQANYHLYEIHADGTGLRQLTDGPYDDIEPSYLPNNDIVFVSSRCKRFVNCWLTQVAVLHVCNADGQDIRAVSSNNEHDNTPWPLPDGRILYTRWEYVDRSQVHYHHLWSAHPDGTSQMTWFGNLHPGTTMIDAKPIAGTRKVVASFSPGHGQREHDGYITVVDPQAGPDSQDHARRITAKPVYRDPWAFTPDCFLAARGPTLVLVDGQGRSEVIYRLPPEAQKAGRQCHEPRPVMPRPREPILPPRSDPNQPSGRMILADVYEGRRMEGVQAGDIKKLLILETLPMPIHYTGGMEPISYGGTFTLERILGTVPVEPDGSAYFEVPARRSVFFVALDEQDLSVKRMQSFTTVQPGETLSCVGCHEHRTQTPDFTTAKLQALQRAPSSIQSIRDVPEIFDYPRDIQPILNDLCVDCHGYEKTDRGGPRAGRLLLTGDRGPLFSHSYYMMTIAGLFSDGRNQPVSNYAPRTLGSSASPLLAMLDSTHYGVQATPWQKKMLRLWIEAGAAYPGTYAALGCGMIGNYIENNQVNTGRDWMETAHASVVVKMRCAGCHKKPERILPENLADERGVSFWQPSMNDPRLNTSRHIVFNLSRPEKSLMLLAPLSRQAGGWGLCQNPDTGDPALVFPSKEDPGYIALLRLVQAGKNHLEKDRRFDMPEFRPRTDWVREMKRYGILPSDITAEAVSDVYAVERDYWESLWHKPPGS